MGQRWQTIPQIIEAAQHRMPPELYDYCSGGAGSEATLRRNRAVFDSVLLRPRRLVEVADIDTATTVMGQSLALPVMPAPVGSIALIDPRGATAVARAAHAAGTAACIGILSSPALEEVATDSPGPLLLQVYARGGRPWLAEVVERAEQAGYAGVVITVDSLLDPRRDRDLVNHFRWREQLGDPVNLTGGNDRDFQVRFTWADLELLRSQTSLPLAVKGLMTAEDARRACDHGVDAVYVSNHGGRTLDHCASGIEALAEVAGAVGDRCEILVDSGVLRGTDVVTALALGARAVLIGKLQCWALAAGGQAALEDALSILRAEVRSVLAHIGRTSLAELDVDCLDLRGTPTLAAAQPD